MRMDSEASACLCSRRRHFECSSQHSCSLQASSGCGSRLHGNRCLAHPRRNSGRIARERAQRHGKRFRHSRRRSDIRSDPKAGRWFWFSRRVSRSEGSHPGERVENPCEMSLLMSKSRHRLPTPSQLKSSPQLRRLAARTASLGPKPTTLFDRTHGYHKQRRLHCDGWQKNDKAIEDKFCNCSRCFPRAHQRKISFDNSQGGQSRLCMDCQRRSRYATNASTPRRFDYNEPAKVAPKAHGSTQIKLRDIAQCKLPVVDDSISAKVRTPRAFEQTKTPTTIQERFGQLIMKLTKLN